MGQGMSNRLEKDLKDMKLSIHEAAENWVRHMKSLWAKRFGWAVIYGSAVFGVGFVVGASLL